MKRMVCFLMLAVAVAVFAVPVAAQTPNLSTSAAYVTEAPVIDGVLNDAAWVTASQMGAKLVSDQDNMGTKISATPRVAYLVYDDYNLYVGILVSTADSSKLVSNAKSYWNNDEVELFLECPEVMKYFKITVDVGGALYEDMGKNESYAAVSVNANSWVVEAVLPFSTLDRTPKAGDVWHFNLAGHQVADGDMWITWNPTYGQFANPSRFGDLVFLP